MKIDDYITYYNRVDKANGADEHLFLRSKMFDVNMRLFKSSEKYKNIITECCNYIKFLALSKYEDYSDPHGMSGANAGIPFNIIGVVYYRKVKNTSPICEIMINPRIVHKSNTFIETESNCGSIRLRKSIKVKRHEWIVVNYFNEQGIEFTEKIRRIDKCFTIEHEIDHNLGILIFDKKIK